MSAEKENIMESRFEALEILGQKVLFTNSRVDRKNLPDGIYAYDLRHDDECQGEICEIKPCVMVNHWGTILCRKPIEMSNNGSRLVSENDYSYLGECISLEEYLKPQCQLIGANGNIFNLMGIASRTLKENDMPERAEEMCNRVMNSGSYTEALGVIDEYVIVTAIDETEDMSPEMTM